MAEFTFEGKQIYYELHGDCLLYTSAGGGTTISASFMTTIQVNAFLAGILGGFSTFYGPVIGAILIPVVSSCVGFLANYQAFSGISRWQMVVVYVLMLLAILLKPEGLFGKKTVKKV